MARYDVPIIVVTGMGVVTPLGNSLSATWQAMLDGVSGAAPISRFDTEKFNVTFACEVKNFDPAQFLHRKEIQRMDMFTHYAMAAATMAIDDAGINFEIVDRERVGVVFGSGVGGMWTYHQQQKIFNEHDGNPDRISPLFVPMMISDIAAGHIAIRWGLKGPNYATVSACSTSAHALADALMLLQRGDVDVMLAGGSEASICPMGLAGFSAMRALSTRNDSPQTASRPFDATRDGFVMGEGGAVLVLETLEHAMNRGARIYAEFSGFGLTDDAHHITAPAEGGEGAVRSMKLALKDAKLTIDDIDYINAHGTSTLYNDKNETAAIKTVFGDRASSLAISSTKSMTGHLLGAAGGVECAATILSLYHGVVPPTINYTTPDPECDLNYMPNHAEKRDIRAALSNSFGFGGHNATLCFQRFEE
jgi:3-oxoacyl-[acyl-carrier-protein] synthase II